MDETEIQATLTSVFQDVFDDASLQIHPEMTAADVDDWDSLTHIGLIVAVEKAFKIKFTTAEVQGLSNVGDFAKLIGAKLR